MEFYWLLNEADFSAQQRKSLAKKGQAMPDGSFPIRNKTDLANAISAYGRAKNKPSAKAHILKRAKALGATDALPADWAGSTKTKESDQPDPSNLNEAERSYQTIIGLISDAAKAKFLKPGIDKWDIYVQDCYEDYAIVRVDGDLWSVPWALTDSDVTLGEPTEVIVTYAPASDATGDGDNDGDDGEMAPPGVPNQESAVTLTSDTIPLLEKAVRRDDTVAIKVIQPGWGSSGYYSKEVLQRDGPNAFPAGTKMYADHPTAAEEAARPERSIKDLWAETVSPARWDEEGLAGPGLYAEAKVLGPKDAIEKLAPHIGVSIRASGKAKQGTAEGKKGNVIEAITAGHSIDFVTVPGAGGQVLSLFEAARGREPQPLQEVHVDEKEAQALRESAAAKDTEIARLKEALVLREARDFAAETLAKVELPDITRARLTESLAAKPVLKDGALDKDGFKAAIEEAVQSEVAYLASITGGGRIQGMGGSGGFGGNEPKLEESAKALESAFADMGLGESTAKLAAAGRN